MTNQERTKLRIVFNDYNAVYYEDGTYYPYKLIFNNNEEILNFMNGIEKVSCYEAFLNNGCQDTYSGFIKMFQNDIFNAETFKPVEIGGNIIGIKPLRKGD